MTVATEQSSIVFTSIVDGVALNVPFPVQATTELKVRYGSSDTLAVMGTHYTVALVPPEYLTATVTPVTGFAALSGGTISVRREVPYTQPTDIPTLATLSSARLEQMFDRIVFITQQVRDGVDYAVRFPTGDTSDNIGVLPLAADRAGRYLAFDINGKPVALGSAAGSSSAFGEQFVQLADEASARTFLDLYTTAQVDAAVAAAITASVSKSIVNAAGDLLVGTANDTLGRLAIGANNRFLKVVAGALAYDQVDLATSDITGILPRANGGFTPTQIENTLGANVALGATGTYYTGPTIAQGTSGRWYVSGHVTVQNTVGGDIVDVRLWDGATDIASTRMHLVSTAGTFYGVAHLSGQINNPTGNLRISVRPFSRTDGAIAYNASGEEMDSKITAFRIG